MKRSLDFICALCGIVVLSPILLITALLVKMKLGSPVIFKQERPGLNEKIFTLYKFRTMTDEKDENGNLMPDEVRLTKFGKWLRSTSLDELPELFNILKGDMSIVGPRPLLPEYLPRYNRYQARRHEVRPGFTGLAQVRGRNAISWEEKFDWDVKYVDHISFLLDMKIIFRTVKIVFCREGISSETSATMEKFEGMVGFPVLGKICEAEQYKNTCEFVIAIGSNAIREKIAEQYNMKWATLVHPTATIGIDVDIEDGTVVMANAVINSSTRIGKHCIINTGAIVEHDNILEDYVHIAPNASLAGAVNIGEKTWVGIGASVKNNVSICDNCLIGAGGVVIKSIETCGTYAGVPVRKVK